MIVAVFYSDNICLIIDPPQRTTVIMYFALMSTLPKRKRQTTIDKSDLNFCAIGRCIIEYIN